MRGSRLAVLLFAVVGCCSGPVWGAPGSPRYETQIMFSGYDRAESLTNFPVLVTLGTHIGGFSYTDFVSPVDGADLRFRRADNDLALDYEIENWDTNGTSHAWVRVDQLASNTAIYAMWGNPAWSTAPASRTNGAVWHGGYEAVWHMNETVTDESSLADAHRDSTSHNRDGDQAGNAHTSGRVAQGQQWDGTDDYIGVTDAIVSTSSLTIATWMKSDGVSAYDAIINHNGWSAGNVHYQFYGTGNGLAYDIHSGWHVGLAGFSFGTGQWYHVVTVYDRSAGSTDGTLALYVDGELKQTSGGLNTAPNPSPAPGRIGSWDVEGRYFHGAMDEFRILNSVPSSNWVWATWLNTASNDHFNSVGSAVYHPTTPVHYVSLTGGNVYPYENWANAATNIQDAIDAAAASETVLVTNGTYNLSGAILMTNSLTLVSVNGRDVTTISGGRNGSCLDLANHAVVVDGFTVRDGYTRYGNGGGIACLGTTPVITNCVLIANDAFHGAGCYKGTLKNCIIRDNICRYSGGGTCQSYLYDCTVSGNTCVAEGGGVYYGWATNCTIIGNVGGWGGGTANANITHCTVSSNRATAYQGGGVYYGTANNSIIVNNHSANDGGGSSFGTRNNCVISGNTAGEKGGGSYYSTLSNCTVTDNTSGNSGGGTSYGDVRNCIVVDNYVGGVESNNTEGAYTYTCSTPLAAGTGNISDDPILLSRSHIATNSPCIGAGSSSYASMTDIDGESWNSPPSIGCDEIDPDSMSGPLNVDIFASRTHAYPNVGLLFIAGIDGKPTHTAWSFGDGGSTDNVHRVSYAWSGIGSYPVVLTAYNTDNPGGVSATVTVHVIAETTHYVSPSGNHVLPYSSWGNAATSIHAAVDVACDGGSVIVADGTYYVSSEIAVETDISVSSVNGAGVTIVDAGGNCRAFNLGARSCTIEGFTITDGEATKGGGVYCLDTTPVINNCTIRDSHAGEGAGVYRGTLRRCAILDNTATSFAGGTGWSTLENCLVAGNYAEDSGGGAYRGTLINCTVVSNSAGMMTPGVVQCTLTNCIVYHNVGWWDPNYSGGSWTHCCTTPMPFSGSGNITNDPQFLDGVAGDYRLGAGSPAIDAGTNLALRVPHNYAAAHS